MEFKPVVVSIPVRPLEFETKIRTMNNNNNNKNNLPAQPEQTYDKNSACQVDGAKKEL